MDRHVICIKSNDGEKKCWSQNSCKVFVSWVVTLLTIKYERVLNVLLMANAIRLLYSLNYFMMIYHSMCSLPLIPLKFSQVYICGNIVHCTRYIDCESIENKRKTEPTVLRFSKMIICWNALDVVFFSSKFLLFIEISHGDSLRFFNTIAILRFNRPCNARHTKSIAKHTCCCVCAVFFFLRLCRHFILIQFTFEIFL